MTIESSPQEIVVKNKSKTCWIKQIELMFLRVERIQHEVDFTIQVDLLGVCGCSSEVTDRHDSS